MVNLNTCLRPAEPNDQKDIAHLVYFEPNVHRHLDWRSPLDWLGAPEYWVLEQGNTISAVLACPPDPPGIAWVRLFAHIHDIPGNEAWEKLWQFAREQVIDKNGNIAVAITLQEWFGETLQRSGFSLTQKIVVLDYDPAQPPYPRKTVSIPLRPMNEKDLPAVAALDSASFLPIWQNSQASLQMAFSQAGLATVMEEDGQLVGYQISTSSPFGVHLARLAVLPSHQGRGLGLALVQDLIRHASQHTLGRITVNTQDDNTSSLSLYKKLGFQLTGEQYPVYTFA
ncbi:MAG: GNAT family N-acetyltransferase [Anaerolineales bacterium]